MLLWPRVRPVHVNVSGCQPDGQSCSAMHQALRLLSERACICMLPTRHAFSFVLRVSKKDTPAVACTNALGTWQLPSTCTSAHSATHSLKLPTLRVWVQITEAAACMPSLLVLQDLHLMCPQEASGGEPSSGPHQQAITDWLAEQLHLLRGLEQGAPPWPGKPASV